MKAERLGASREMSQREKQKHQLCYQFSQIEKNFLEFGVRTGNWDKEKLSKWGTY